MNDYLALFAGVICAGVGGELFVRAVVGLAHWARISPGIIGATVAAFATSSPELSVSSIAAASGHPEIGLGDATGSNVVNVGLILSCALLISGIQAPRDSIKRDFPIALLCPALTFVLALDGRLSRVDGFILLAVFIIWIAAAIFEAKRQRSAAEEVLGEQRRWLAVVLCLAGLAFLFAAGHFIVTGAEGIAASLGINAFVIGATVVAIGTSVPELATTVISKIRGHDEIGLGTVLGSNIFNGFFIVAVAAIIHPIPINLRQIAIGLTFGLLTVALTFPTRSGLIERKRGAFLLALYVAYVITILQR